MKLAPLLFVSHGSPTFAIDTGQAAQNLAHHASLFNEVEGIIAISPHWITHGNYIIGNESPGTLHDFYGFPQKLYELAYSAQGSPSISNGLLELLTQHYIEAKVVTNRDWDHGVWVPLMHLRPDADIPIVQLSLNADMSADNLVHLGRVLSDVRQRNIAIVCSGAVTHNLGDLRTNHQAVADYAMRFEEWVRHIVVSNNLEDAKKPNTASPYYDKAHPTPEHYLPLLIAMSAARTTDNVEVLSSPILHHSISMESYLWSSSV